MPAYHEDQIRIWTKYGAMGKTNIVRPSVNLSDYPFYFIRSSFLPSHSTSHSIHLPPQTSPDDERGEQRPLSGHSACFPTKPYLRPRPRSSESDLFMPASSASTPFPFPWSLQARTAAAATTMMRMSSEHVDMDVGRREKQDYRLNNGRGRGRMQKKKKVGRCACI